MADTPTKVPLATTTLSSAAASYTFSSIPSTYTDLILVASMADNNSGADQRMLVQVNGDTGSNYSCTTLYGNGSTATSRRLTSRTQFDNKSGAGNSITSPSANIYHFQNYSNTTTYKTVLYRQNNLVNTAGTSALVGLWRSTSAINSITISCMGSLIAGSTFTLYGIL